MAEMFGRALMLGSLVAVACAAAASADGTPTPTLGTAPAERAMAWPVHRAIIAFGHASCGTPAILLGDFVDADVVAGADPVGCSIYLNAAVFRKMSKAMVCTLVLHEYGHLAGRQDNDDPGSVMYRYYSRPDRRCSGTGS
jgi:hypothetical protein